MGDGKAREGNRKCALCEGKAELYCESDEAMLCWNCDAHIHSANFLVARHVRALLCRSCRAPTTWSASGARLTPTVSLCSRCCFRGGDQVSLEGEIQPVEDEQENEEVEQGVEEEEEEEVDNQVVPWQLMPVTATVTPPVATSSSSDGSTSKLKGNNPADRSSSPTKDDEAEPTSTLITTWKWKDSKDR